MANLERKAERDVQVRECCLGGEAENRFGVVFFLMGCRNPREWNQRPVLRECPWATTVCWSEICMGEARKPALSPYEASWDFIWRGGFCPSLCSGCAVWHRASNVVPLALPFCLWFLIRGWKGNAGSWRRGGGFKRPEVLFMLAFSSAFPFPKLAEQPLGYLEPSASPSCCWLSPCEGGLLRAWNHCETLRKSNAEGRHVILRYTGIDKDEVHQRSWSYSGESRGGLYAAGAMWNVVSYLQKSKHIIFYIAIEL